MSFTRNGGTIGGTIALLNLPAFSVLSMNASASQTLKSEEQLLVISNIQPSNGCHLLVVRGGGNVSSQNGHNGVTLHSIGLLILQPSSDSCNGNFNDDVVMMNSDEQGYDSNWFVARKFDAQTEEISSQSLDKISYNNLRQSVERRENINVSRIIPHNRLFNSNMGEGQNSNDIWSKFLTHFISKDVLSMHGLTGRGDKIVPGTFSHEDDNLDPKVKDEMKEEDGHSLKYPPIPHVDPKQSHRVNAHSGTKRFLSTLSPSERTQIFLAINNCDLDEKDVLFEKVLSTYYSGNSKILLGQLQLSFIVFLCCSCLSSLEHWRDTIQMLSLVKPSTIMSNSDLFEQLLIIIQYQLFGLNNDLFDDQEILDGNCLIPAIERLCMEIPDENEQDARELNNLSLNDNHEDEDDEEGPIVLSMDEINALIKSFFF